MRIHGPWDRMANDRATPSITNVFDRCGGTAASHYGIIVGLLLFAGVLVWTSVGPQLATLFFSLI